MALLASEPLDCQKNWSKILKYWKRMYMLWFISEKNVMILPKGMWLVLYVCQFNWQSKINGCDKFGWQCNRNSIKPPTLLWKLFKHTCNQHTCISSINFSLGNFTSQPCGDRLLKNIPKSLMHVHSCCDALYTYSVQSKPSLGPLS